MDIKGEVCSTVKTSKVIFVCVCNWNEKKILNENKYVSTKSLVLVV